MPIYDLQTTSYDVMNVYVLKRIWLWKTVKTQLKRRVLHLVELHDLVMSLDIHGLIWYLI